MEWLNEPAKWYLEGDRLQVTADPKTDFWRVTHYGFTRDSGHFYFERVAGDFMAQVKVVGEYRGLYDQAGLMVRLDERNWIKCGVEYVEGRQNASAVVTRDFSDWSVAPLPGDPAAFWLRVIRRGDHVEVHISLDGEGFTLMRIGYLVPSQEAMVGSMCAAPEGDGFDVSFDEWKLNRL